MLKWLLVGWMCTGAGEQQVCLRMASEVVHESFDQCDQYYGVIAEELRDPGIFYRLIVCRHILWRIIFRPQSLLQTLFADLFQLV